MTARGTTTMRVIDRPGGHQFQADAYDLRPVA
jgi:hypothetical protein